MTSGIVLAIDPSTTATGYAIGCWNYESARPIQLHTCGLIEDGGMDWKNRAMATAANLRQKARPYAIRIVVSEIPQPFKSSTGMKSASSGSVHKLAVAAGMYIGCFMHPKTVPNQIVLVEPSEWKGQVPKEITYDRLCRRGLIDSKMIPRTDKGFNVSDAVGILVWYLDKECGYVKRG